MKILHTSDVHLIEYGDKRWKAMEEIINVANKEKVDLLIIAGDLFDSSAAVDMFRSKVRSLFSGNPFKIIIVSGNHDYSSIESMMYFGDDVIIRDDYERPIYESKNVKVWQLPYEKIGESEVYKRLKKISELINREQINILVLHCELMDSFFNPSDYGQEEGYTYMPVKLSMFKNLGFKYVLAGHFHKKFRPFKIDNESYFVYPGSPVSITKKETGKRAVNLFEVGDKPHEYVINTRHYLEKIIFIDPFRVANPLDYIKNEIENLDKDNNTELLLKIKGYINSALSGISEIDFYKGLELIIKENKLNIVDSDLKSIVEVIDIRNIVDDKIYSDFKEILQSTDGLTERDKQDIDRILIEAFIRIKR